MDEITRLQQLTGIITEGKQVGNLYHFTYIENIPKILEKGLKFEKDNINRGSFENKYSISTTRDKRGTFWRYKTGMGYIYGRIVIDGNLVSNSYKIIPVNADNIWGNIKQDPKSLYYNVKLNNFSEERIINDFPSYLPIKYIKEIHLPKKVEEIENNALVMGIPVIIDSNILNYDDTDTDSY